MIILPDRHIPRSRFLMPVATNQWRTPSLAQPKDMAGNENQTRFRLTARLHDGHIAWRGWFDDRDDVDAFLFAMASGTLLQSNNLWRLPSPEWHPGLGEGLTYEFATVTFLVTTGANNYTTPADWNAASNSIETLGGGSSGNSASNGNRSCGAGGAYSKILNLAISGVIAYTLGVGGASVTGLNTSNAGGDTWFNGASLAASSVGSKGGSAATTAASTGGAAASGVGTKKYSGGNGLAGVGAANAGGGGAAGPAGAGGNGTATQGGSANNGTTAGPTTMAAGNAGTEWDSTHGCGTGAFEVWTPTNPSSNGGVYGGGGALCGASGGSGTGAQGLIVISYTPAAMRGFNMPMLGM